MFNERWHMAGQPGHAVVIWNTKFCGYLKHEISPTEVTDRVVDEISCRKVEVSWLFPVAEFRNLPSHRRTV
jgi:hypothetical protein